MAKRVGIRPLTLGDKEMVYRWRNSETQVAFSRTGRSVSRIEHAQWMREIVFSNSELAYIINCDSLPVGLLRIKLSQDYGYISIYLVTSHRRGIGSQALWMAMRDFYTVFKPKGFLANVVKTNNRSCKFFRKNHFTGYKLVDGLWEFYYGPSRAEKVLFRFNLPIWAYRARCWLERCREITEYTLSQINR